MLRAPLLVGALLATLLVPWTAAAQPSLPPCPPSVAEATATRPAPFAVAKAAPQCSVQATASAQPERAARAYDSDGLLLSVTIETWNGQAWELSRRTVFTYDAAGRETTSTHEIYQGGAWTPEMRIVRTYTPAGLMHVWLHQMWTGTGWADNSRTTYGHDAMGNETSVLSEMWFNGAWRNSFRSAKVYNAMRLVLDERYEMWTEDGWMLHDRHTYAYNAAGKPTEHVDYEVGDVPERKEIILYDELGRAVERVESKWVVPAGWTPFERNIHPEWLAGDPAFQMTAYRTQRWNADAARWDDHSRFLGTYSPSFRLMVELTQNWDAPAQAWVNDEKWEYDYDLLGERSQEMLSRWDATAAAWRVVFGNRAERTFTAALKLASEETWFWREETQTLVPDFREVYAYDAQQRVVEILSSRWVDGAWVNDSRTRLAYRGGVAAEDPALADALRVRVWPQPARDGATVRLDAPAGLAVRAVLYDLLGREVRTLWDGPLAAPTDVRVDGLPSGRYLLRVAAGGKTLVQPVVTVR